MGRLLFSLVLIPLFLFLQHPFRAWEPLACFLPILTVLWAWRVSDLSLLCLVIAAGLLEDFLVPDAFLGSSILVWGAVALLVRTQRTLMNSFLYLFIVPILFASSLLFLTLDRIIFLTNKGFWSWNESLMVHIVIASALNAIIGPLIFAALISFYPHQRIRVEDLPDLPHVHP